MSNSLKKRVMVRVYLHYARNAFGAYPDVFMFVIFLATSFTLVSFRDVFINLSSNNFRGVFSFLVSAIKETSLILQILMAGFVIRVAAAGVKWAHKNLRPMTNINWLLSRVRY